MLKLTLHPKLSAWLLWLFVAAPILAQDPFIEMNPFGTDQNASNGVAWADYDNDGWEDIYIANGSDMGGQRNFLYHNNGNDTFTKITTGNITTDSYLSGSCSWGDFDNDGDADLYVPSVGSFSGGNSQNCLYENLGNGTFLKNTTAGPAVTDAEHSGAAAWGDANNDSYLDLVVTQGYTTPLPNKLYVNDGDKTFTSITGIDLVNAVNAAGLVGLAWADYDNDGDLDVFAAGNVSGGNPRSFLWRNDGALVFTKLTPFEAAYSQAGSWGDYDNDGDLDLYITNYGASETAQERNFLYRNNGGDSFTKMTPAQVGALVDDPIISKGSAWGDIDNDGDLDLFVTTPGDPAENYFNYLYINNDGFFAKNTTSVVTQEGWGFGAAMADYNKDGFLDLLVCTSYADPLYKNAGPINGNTNHWIQIKLVGTTSNASAIGAHVSVRATINSETVWQLREISGQTGYGSQNSLLAHFGLGDATSISEVRVEWPSGAEQVLNDVSVDQFLTITEGGTTESITVMAPNGGESWMVGATETITWTSSGASAAVNLDYSTNNGASWTPIVAGTANDGSHDWTIPNAPSALCLVRATDADGSPADASDAVFIIVAVPDPVGDLVASVLGENILLKWSPQVGVTTYNVYRGTSYNFVPDFAGGANRIGTNISDQDAGTAGVQWTDTGNGADVVGDLANNYFYRVSGTPGVETAASNLAGEFDRQFLTTAGTDINELVVIMDTQDGRTPLLTAENLAQAIPNCTDVYQWIATGQGQVGHPKGTPINNFVITAGYPYIVNVSANTIWTNAGAYAMPSFSLITTTGTDINHIGLPFEKSALTTAEALGDDITSCTDVYYWDVAGQGHVGHPVNTPVQNFGVTAGLPYYVNVTSASTWPAGGAGAPQAPILADLAKSSNSTGKFGGNIPHTAFGKISSAVAFSSLTLTAWIEGRPHDVLTETSVGTGLGQGYWWVGVGNFASAWQIGEKLNVEIKNKAGRLVGVTQVLMTDAGSDQADISLSLVSKTDSQSDLVPEQFKLYANYPNPFNPKTTIAFDLPQDENVVLAIYDVRGVLVKTMLNQRLAAGHYDLVWNGADQAGGKMASGLYFYKLVAGGFSETRKMVLTK